MLIAVAILFYPNAEDLAAFIPRVTAAVDALVVVDNTPGGCGHDFGVCERLFYVPLNENRGIAAAHNVGICRAIRAGASQILLLDQDSVIAPETVQALRLALQGLQAQGGLVAAVGASYVETHTDRIVHAMRVAGKRVVAEACPEAGAPVETDILISSGSLINVESLRVVGLMSEALFIDYVDLEWCLRAKAHGWRCFIVPDARMTHTIGSARVRTASGNLLSLHSNFRLHYQVRNGFLLWTQRWIEPAWRREFFRQGVLCQGVANLVYSRQRLPALRAILDGLQEGARLAICHRKGLPQTRLEDGDAR